MQLKFDDLLHSRNNLFFPFRPYSTKTARIWRKWLEIAVFRHFLTVDSPLFLWQNAPIAKRIGMIAIVVFIIDNIPKKE